MKKLKKGTSINKNNKIENMQDNDLNELPFNTAINIDKRTFLRVFLRLIPTKIEIIDIIFFHTKYQLLSVDLTSYLFGTMLDIMLNAFLFSDDNMAEKYDNGRELRMITSLSLSLASNFVRSILMYFIHKLKEYKSILEIIEKESFNEKIYYILMGSCLYQIKLKIELFFLYNLYLVYF